MSKQPGVRWRRRKHARPGEILTAALACFKERGFARTRLEDVAAKAGVTKGTVYLYYANKEELFKAVIRGELIPNVDRLKKTLAEPGAASAQLERLITFWMHEIAPSPLSVIPKIIFGEAGNFPDLARFFLEAVPCPMRQLLASILRRGIEQGEFRPMDVEHVVYCIIGPLIFSLLWQHSLGPHDDRPLDVQAVCRAHLDLILHGLRVATPSSQKPSRQRGKR